MRAAKVKPLTCDKVCYRSADVCTSALEKSDSCIPLGFDNEQSEAVAMLYCESPARLQYIWPRHIAKVSYCHIASPVVLGIFMFFRILVGEGSCNGCAVDRESFARTTAMLSKSISASRTNGRG